jgi:hypothetical protein
VRAAVTTWPRAHGACNPNRKNGAWTSHAHCCIACKQAGHGMLSELYPALFQLSGLCTGDAGNTEEVNFITPPMR